MAVHMKSGVSALGLVVCCIAGLAPCSVHAQASSSSASITDLQFQALDLDITDGLAAGFTLTGGLTELRGTVFAEGGIASSYRHVPGWMTPRAVDAVQDNTTTHAAATASSLQASTQTFDFGSRYSASAASVAGSSLDGLGLEISPHSAVAISADWDVFAAVDGPCLEAANCRQASANVVFSLWGPVSDQQSFSVATEYRAANPDPLHSSGAYTFTVYNPSDNPILERLQFSASAAGLWAPVFMVPEPATPALWIAGLLGLALVGRQKRRSLAGRLVLAGLGGGALLMGPAAAMAASSSASVTPVQFVVQDLDPDDGQLATYRLDSAATSLSTEARQGIDPWESFNRFQAIGGWGAPFTLDASLDGVSSTASTGAAGWVSSGVASGALTSYDSTAASSASVSQGGGIWLAPHTSVSLTADWALSATIDAPPCAAPATCEYAAASVLLAWAGALAPESSQRFTLEARPTSADPAPLPQSGTFSFTLVNDFDDWRHEALAIETHAWGSTLAVPEPSTLTLMLGGVAAIAAIGRRRSRHTKSM